MAKRRKFCAIAPIRRTMKNDGGAKIVSGAAVISLVEWLEDKTITITKRALALARHAGRKTIQKKDIKLAVAE